MWTPACGVFGPSLAEGFGGRGQRGYWSGETTTPGPEQEEEPPDPETHLPSVWGAHRPPPLPLLCGRLPPVLARPQIIDTEGKAAFARNNGRKKTKRGRGMGRCGLGAGKETRRGQNERKMKPRMWDVGCVGCGSQRRCACLYACKGRAERRRESGTELRRFCAEFIHPPCEQYKRGGHAMRHPPSAPRKMDRRVDRGRIQGREGVRRKGTRGGSSGEQK